MAFEAGRLDVKLALLRRVLTHDGTQRVESWVLLGYRYCSRMPRAGGEQVDADARRSVGRFSLWLRRDSVVNTLTGADAVAFNGQRYDLTEPPREVEKMRRRGIELLVEGTGEAWTRSGAG
ncbi:MAG: phage head completion protein [Rhabdaerophilum sp.]